MRFLWVFYSAWLALVAWAAPLRRFDTRLGPQKRFDDSLAQLAQRDFLEDTISEILVLVNQLGIIFSALDLIADHPDRQEALANTTSNLIKGAGSLNILLAGIDFGDILDSLNLTQLIGTIADLGLIGLLADGILLDKTFRPNLEKLIYDAVSAAKPALYYLFNDILGQSQKRSIEDLTPDDIAAYLGKRAELDDLFSQLLGTQTAAITANPQQSFVATTTGLLDALFGPADTAPAQANANAATTTYSGGALFDALFGPLTAVPSVVLLAAELAATAISEALTSALSRLQATTTSRRVSSKSSASSKSLSQASVTISGDNWLDGLFAATETGVRNSTTTSIRPKATQSIDLNWGSGNASSNSGSAGLMLTNVLSGVLLSGLFNSALADVVNALNNTGVAVLVVQQFLSDPKYVNMTVNLATDVWNSGAISLNLTSVLTQVNFTAVFTYADSLISLSNFGDMLDSVLAGNFTSVLSGLGKYADAVGEIATDLENKGLFAELNEYIFGNKTSDSEKELKKEAASSLVSALATASGQGKKDNAASAPVAHIGMIMTPMAVVLGLLAL